MFHLGVRVTDTVSRFAQQRHEAAVRVARRSHASLHYSDVPQENTIIQLVLMLLLQLQLISVIHVIVA